LGENGSRKSSWNDPNRITGHNRREAHGEEVGGRRASGAKSGKVSGDEKKGNGNLQEGRLIQSKGKRKFCAKQRN